MHQKTTAETTVKSFMNDGYLLTAHAIAKMTGYSPQHINRVLKKLFNQGVIAYAIVNHQGAAKYARKWCSLKSTKEHTEFTFVIPEYTQLEMTF